MLPDRKVIINDRGVRMINISEYQLNIKKIHELLNNNCFRVETFSKAFVLNMSRIHIKVTSIPLEFIEY